MLKEIVPNVYLGDGDSIAEFEELFDNGVVIHAAKDPWHREHLGYTGRGAPKDHPEYLVAETEDELFLNLVDTAKPEFIPRECFDAALTFFIQHHILESLPILIHCNQGQSRSVGVLAYILFNLCECSEVADMEHEIAAYTGGDLDETLALLDNVEYEHKLGDGVYGALTNWGL